MSVAVALSLVTTSVNLAMGLMFLGFSVARRWRIARVFATIALSGSAYGVTGIVMGSPNLPEWAWFAAARVAYVVATVHCSAWLVHAFGDGTGDPRRLPPTVQRVILAALALTSFFAVTGLHLRPEMATVEVPWAGVTYHYPLTTTLGDLFGLLPALALGGVFVKLLARYRAGEEGLRWQLVGFGLFFACVADEILVAERVIQFLSLGDLGFLCVVLPLAVVVARQVTQDAQRLRELSEDLESAVRVRTEERDDARTRLVESERLAALGRLAAGVGHEINNPLAYVILALDEVELGMGQRPVPETSRQALADARDGARRIQKVVEGLRGYSQPIAPPTALEPADLVRAALRIAGPKVRHLGSLVVELNPAPRVLGQEPQLVQALINLVVNAAQAIGPDPSVGRIHIRTETTASGEAALVVADNGPGIPPEHLHRLSDPYFTTKASSGGLGLGLYITRSIVDAHRGRLEFGSPAEGGAEVRITLPALATEPEIAVPRPAPPSAATATAQRRLLLIDDEPVLLRLIARQLSQTWAVRTVTSARDALALVQEESFDAIVCDLMMPGMSGIQFAAVLHDILPALRQRTLFLTGGAVTDEAQAFLERTDVLHLEKPVDTRTLHAALEALAASPGVAA